MEENPVPKKEVEAQETLWLFPRQGQGHLKGRDFHILIFLLRPHGRRPFLTSEGKMKSHCEKARETGGRQELSAQGTRSWRHTSEAGAQVHQVRL